MLEPSNFQNNTLLKKKIEWQNNTLVK